jgi:hypothetical protein
MGSPVFCGVAQIAVHRSHKPVGGGASPPATSNLIVVSTGVRPGLISPGELPDQRRRLGSTPRTTTICPWPEGFRGPCYERGSQWLDSTHGCQFIPTPTELRRRPSEGGLRVFDSLRGCHFAVEAHRDVQRIGNAQAAGANPAIGTRYALQALTAERPSRNREVDRATRSWGTNHGSLTQRDRDPPFKRSDPGAIPGRPTNHGE